MYIYPRLITGPTNSYLFFNSNFSYLNYVQVAHGDSSWSGVALVATGGWLSANYDVASGPNGIIGVAFDNQGLYYREFDGANWGAVETLDSNICLAPQVIFTSGNPIVVFLSLLLNGIYALRYTHRQSGSFSVPSDLQVGDGYLSSVQIYDPITARYEELTAAASSSTGSDIYHSATGCFLKDANEAAYLGSEQPFRFLQGYFPTAGTGGTIEYSYWDGSSWKSFTPSAGTVNFDSSSVRVQLFEDLSSIPTEWQRAVIEGKSLFWLRLRVTAAFTNGPIGTSLTAYPFLYNLSFIR